MTTLSVFKATIPSINFIFSNGKPAIFVSGVYRTEVDWEIKELQKEISSGHPHIYIDPQETTIESDMVDPMNALRAKIIAEYVAKEKAAAGDTSRDMGISIQQPIKPANTLDISDAAMGGSGNQVRLAGLKK